MKSTEPFGLSKKVGGSGRLRELDGLRCVAILLVIGYHYYNGFMNPDFGPMVYPYGGAWSEVFPFHYGHYGVQLFFVISGFVITLSLYKSRDIGEFFIRRFARLWPAMLLCSSCTFLVVKVLPISFSVKPSYFLPSLTFIDPYFLRTFERNLRWMDPSYWSLFIEVKFYLLASTIYFVQPKLFARNLGLVFMMGTVLYLVYLEFLSGNRFSRLIFYRLISPEQLPWFFFGVGSYFLTKKEDKKQGFLIVLTTIVNLVISLVLQQDYEQLIAAAMIFSVFVLALRLALFRRLLSSNVIVIIGASSYSLYLIHQYVGLTLINYLAQMGGIAHRFSIYLPMVVTVGLMIFAKVVYERWERPISKWILKKALRTKE